MTRKTKLRAIQIAGLLFMRIALFRLVARGSIRVLLYADHTSHVDNPFLYNRLVIQW